MPRTHIVNTKDKKVMETKTGGRRTHVVNTKKKQVKTTKSSGKKSVDAKTGRRKITLPGNEKEKSSTLISKLNNNLFGEKKNGFSSFSSDKKNNKNNSGKVTLPGGKKGITSVSDTDIKKVYEESKKKNKYVQDQEAKAELAKGVTEQEENRYKPNFRKPLVRGTDAIGREEKRIAELRDRDIQLGENKLKAEAKTQSDKLYKQTEKAAMDEINSVYNDYAEGRISYDEFEQKANHIADIKAKEFQSQAERLYDDYNGKIQDNSKHIMAAWGKSRNGLTTGLALSTKETIARLANSFVQAGASTAAGGIDSYNKAGGAAAAGRTGRTYTRNYAPSYSNPYLKMTKDEMYRNNYGNRENAEIAKSIMEWVKETKLNQYVEKSGATRALFEESVAGSNKTVDEIWSQTLLNVPTMVISMLQPEVGLGLFGISAMGMSAMSAYDNGATIEDAVNYGLFSGVMETATEKIFYGVGGVYGKALSSSLWHGLVGKATKAKAYRLLTQDTITALQNSRFANSVSGKILKGVLIGGGEATEEMIAEIIDPYLQRATFNPHADAATFNEILEAGLMGFAVSAVLGVPVNVMNINNQIRYNNLVKNMNITELDRWAQDEQFKAFLNYLRNGKSDQDGYFNRLAEIDETYNRLSSDMGSIKAKTKKTESKVIGEPLVEANAAEKSANNFALISEDGAEISVVAHDNGSFTRHTYKVSNGKIDKGSRIDTALEGKEAKAMSKRYADMKNTANVARSTGATYGVKDDVINLAEQVQNRTGNNVHFFYGEAGENGRIEGNDIYINVNSRNASSQIISHEFTHLLESNSETYDEMLNAVKDFYGKSYDEYAEEIQKGYAKFGVDLSAEKIKGKNHSKLDDEVIAHFVEQKLLTNEQAIERFTDINRSNPEKVIDAINDVIIKAAGNKEQRALVKFRKLWQQAYSEAVGAAKGSNRNSIDESIRLSVNVPTMDYAINNTIEDDSTRERFVTIKDCLVELSQIQKRFNKERIRNIHNINDYLKNHKDIWQQLINIQDRANKAGVNVKFVTPIQNKTTIEGKEVDAGVIGIPIEYVDPVLDKKGNAKKRYKFMAFNRRLPQMFFDGMNLSDKEEFRKELVKAGEKAYAIHYNIEAPFEDLTEVMPSKKEVDKKIKDALNDAKKVINPASLTTLGGSKVLKGVQAPLRKAEKTMAALNLNSACPMFTIGNHGCYLDACYLTQMANGANGLNLFQSAVYTCEILQMKQSDIDMINERGGLRINGLGDTIMENAPQFEDIIRHCLIRGLNVKIITKQKATLKILQDLKNKGYDISGATVQPSMDNLWIPAELDDIFGAGIRGTVGIADTIKKGNLQAAADAYKDIYGREARVGEDGMLYRKYGFSPQQIAEMREEFPDVNVVPRYVVCTAKEIAEVALNRDNWVVNNGKVIQTLMHGKVPEGCISEYDGEVLNFGSARHIVEKVDGKWRFYGEPHGNKDNAEKYSRSHQKVQEYVENNYTPEEQEKIWTTLKEQLCCQENTFKDACAGCQSLCSHGGAMANAIEPIEEKKIQNNVALSALDFSERDYFKSFLKGENNTRHSYDINSDYSGASMSKRAEGENNKRYSRDIDTSYLAAVERGDMETVQRMVDERAFDVYSERINKYLSNISNLSVSQLEDGITKLGFLNSIAYKGYRKLNDFQSKHNGKIYEIKGNAVYEFAKEWKKRGLDVSYSKGVVYFRKNNGIQISFHTVDDSTYNLLGSSNTEWDGVENAFAYNNPSEYRRVKDEKERITLLLAKWEKEQTEYEYKKLYEYLRKYKRAEKYGINLEKDLENNGTWVFIRTTAANVDNIFRNVFNTTKEAYDRNMAISMRDYVDEINPKYRYIYNDNEIREKEPKPYKLTDPVTYDDNGNIIPLSQRFNESNDDIRWSRDVEGISGDIKAAAKELLSDIRAVSYSRKRSDNEKAKQLINSIYGSIVRSGIYDHEKANELVDFLYETGYQNVEMDNAFEDVLSGSKILISDEFKGDMVSVGGLRTVNQKLFPYHITFAYNKHQHHNLDDYYTSFAAANKFVEESIDPAEQVAQIVDAYTAKVKKVSLEQLDREAYEEYGIEAENLYKKDIERAVFDFADTLVNLVSEQNEKRARKEGFKKGEAKSAAKAIKKGVKQEQREQRKRDEATLKEFDKMLKAQNREERKAAEEVLRLADKIISEARKEERALTKAEEKAIRDKVVADKNMVIKALMAIRKDLESEAARKEREQRRNDEANIRMHDKIVSGKDAAIKVLNRKEEQRTAAERKKQRRAIIKADLQKAKQLAREEHKRAKENRDKTHNSIARSKAKKAIDNFRTDIFNWLIGKNLWEFQTVKKDKNTNELVLVDEKNNVVASFNDEMGAFELAYFGRRGRFVPTAGLSYLAENVGMNVDRFYTIYYEIKNLQAGGKGKKKRVYDYINSLAITNRQKMFLMEYVAGYYAAEFPPFLSGGNITPPKGNARGRMFEILDRISIDLFDEYKHPAIEDIDKLIEAAIPNATQEQKDAFKLFIEKRILETEKDIEVAREGEETQLATEESIVKPAFREKFKKGLRKLYSRVFADGAAIEELSREINDPLITARYYEAVKSSAIASRMINETFQEDLHGRAMGKGLYEIFKPIFAIKDKGKTLEDLTRYCNYRHDIDRIKYDKGYTGFTINELKEKMKEIEKKYDKNGKNIVVETADLIVKYSRNLLYINVQAGRISKETYDFFVDRYPNYVPTYRVQEDQYIDRKGNIRTRDKKIIKEARGGNETVLPLYAQLSRRTKEMVAAAKKNQLALEIARAAEISKDSAYYIRGIVTSDEAASAEDLWEQEDEGRITGLRKGDSYIPVYIDGKRCVIDVIDEEILYGWDVINLPLKRCFATDVLERINDMRKDLLTKYNLTFWATNLPKDLSEMIVLNHHAIGNAKYLPVAVVTIFKPTTQNHQKRYAKGKYKAGEFRFKSNESAYNQKKEIALSEREREYYQFLWDIYMSKGASQSSIFDYTEFSPKNPKKTTRNKVKKIGSLPLDGLDKLNFMVEQTPRFAVFLESVDRLSKDREKGLNSYTDDEIYTLAAYDASDATVNFSRSGRVTKYLNTFGVTFLNANLQGFDKVRRAFTDNEDITVQRTILNISGLVVKLCAFGVGVGIFQEWLYGGLGGGDDDDSDEILKLLYGNDYKTVKEKYRQLPDYIRYGYLVFWVDGEFVKIPRGRLVSAINTALESSIQIAAGNKTPYEGIKEGAGAFVSDVLPQTPLNGGVFQPIFDIAKNSDHWLNPIVSDWEDKGEGLHYLEYDEDTSQVAIDIAYAMHYLTGTLLGDEQALIDLSPLKIDYLIDQYAGSYKDFVRAVIGDNIEDDMITAAYNLAKKFVFNPIEKDRAAGDYYDYKERATNLAKADDNESPYAPLNSLFSEYSDSISKLRDEIKAVADDDSLSWAEKRSKTLVLKDKLNDLYREALSDAKQLYQYSLDTYSGKDDNATIAQEWIAENKSAEWQFNRLSESELKQYNESGLDKNTYITALNAKKTCHGSDTMSAQDKFVSWLDYQNYSKVKKEQIFGAFYKGESPIEFSDGKNTSAASGMLLAGEGWEQAKAQGISASSFSLVAGKMSEFHSDYDENGKTTKAKKDYVAEWIDTLDGTAAQKETLWYTAAGYKTDPPIKFKNGGTEKMPQDTTSPLTSFTRMSTPYGYNIQDGVHNGRLHDGIDLAAPKGTPCMACGEAKVVKVTHSSGGYGNYVEYELTSGEYKGYHIFYGHMSTTGVSVGDTLNAGDIVGEVGSTGHSTGNHLHIGAKDPNGNSIDPRSIVEIEGAGTPSGKTYKATYSGGGNSYGGSGKRSSSKLSRSSSSKGDTKWASTGVLPGGKSTSFKTSGNYVSTSSGATPTGRGRASASYGTAGVTLPRANENKLPTVAQSRINSKRTSRTGTSWA